MKAIHFVLGLALMSAAAPINWADLYHQGFPSKGNLNQAHRDSILVDGQWRSFLISQPQGVGPFPVVILLHGGTQSAAKVWVQTSLPTLVSSKSFILIAPEGVGGHWNDGRGATIANDGPSTANDVGFLQQLIGSVGQWQGNPQKVSLTGISNGGFMVWDYVCAGALGLHAAAAVDANLSVKDSSQCHTHPGLNWMQINGSLDPLVPFGGMPAQHKSGQDQPALLSADQSFQVLNRKIGCGAQIARDSLAFVHADEWVEWRHFQCADHQLSEQLVMHGTGHTWPGSRNGLIIKHLFGGSDPNLDAGELLWDFFSR